MGMYYSTKLRDKVAAATEGVGKGERLKLQAEVARECYDNESAEVKEKVQARMEELRQVDKTANVPLGMVDTFDKNDSVKA